MHPIIIYFLCIFLVSFLWGWFSASSHKRSTENTDIPTLPPSAELARTLTTPNAPPLTQEQVNLLRPLVLHWLGLRTDTDNNRLAREVTKTLRQRWYALDLQHLGTGNTPAHAMLAFACLRCAFYLRAAAALGWLDAALYNQITHLNVLRTRECFADWSAFCHAFHQGRSHWQTSGRTDIFGDHVSPEHLQAWLWLQQA